MPPAMTSCVPSSAVPWGPSLSEDGACLTVCVEAAADSAMMSNLKAGAPVAATVARLVSHTTVQIKGRAVGVSVPTSERLAAVADHIERFCPRVRRWACPRPSPAVLSATT